jgi:hypothetical protein
MGSGHILVYAFDVLYEIYLSAGYSERELPTLILEKNLYGLDIDDRAGQLATFALLMKARSKNRRIFRHKPKMNLCSIQESNDIPKEAIEYLVNPKETELEKYFYREDVEYLIEVFHDAKEYGSILEVKEIDFDALENRIEEIRNGTPENIFELQYREEILEKIPPLIQQAKIMSQKYDVVCTNPPYMGRKGMNPNFSNYINDKYPDSKSDLFAVFMECCVEFTKKNKFTSMLTQNSWMFLFSFHSLRLKIYSNFTMINMVHLGYGTFGADFGTTTFVLRKLNIRDYNALYVRLVDYRNIEEKDKQYFNKENYMLASFEKFRLIPGNPLAYWASEAIFDAFDKGIPVGNLVDVKRGMTTSDNNRFLRYWFEINIKKAYFDAKNHEEALLSKAKWFPYSKGGGYRKWYGYNQFLIDWENNGKNVIDFAKTINRSYTRTIVNIDYYFLPSVGFSYITTGPFSMRWIPEGFLYDSGGPGMFGSIEKRIKLIAIMNSKPAQYILKLLNPTINLQIADIIRLPFLFDEGYLKRVRELVKENIFSSKTDWDSFETTWDFKKHLLLTHKQDADTIEEALKNWSIYAEKQFNQLKANEEELNRIFIEIYGLQDELTPAVDDKDVTITRIYESKEEIPESMKGNNYVLTKEDVIKSFISYAIGCMFGRYSLDEEGLIYAGGDFDDKFRLRDGQWEIKTKEGWKKSRVNIVEHNVIPIADGDYFEDGILERFVEFVKVSFGEETLEENLEYIAETLGKKVNETSRQAIRRYFLKDFYKDHVRTYKKRPIYWLFDSGRQDGFKALIYMHRYELFTVARVRTDYLHSLQKKYEAEINHLDILIDSDISQREKAAARKKKETILKQIEECRLYDEAIAHMANQRIEIDLDDGVKVNYAKFQGVEIPQGKGRKPLKADLLAKI